MKASIATLVMLVGAGAGVSGSAMASTSVLAHEHEDTRQVVVRYGDLNVDTPQGAEQLYSRISHAAHTVCGVPGDPMYKLDHAYHRCLQTTLEQAVATVDHAKVTALYDQHFRGSHVADAGSASDRGLRSST